jgi:mono/diheme cytochrome c family protein
MTTRNIFTAVISLFILSACAQNKALSKKADTQIEEVKQPARYDAKDIFMTKCAVCHGADGTAGTNHAANLQLSRRSIPAIIQIIQKGGGRMPSFKMDLNETEIESIADYVRRLQRVKIN